MLRNRDPISAESRAESAEPEGWVAGAEAERAPPARRVGSEACQELIGDSDPDLDYWLKLEMDLPEAARSW